MLRLQTWTVTRPVELTYPDHSKASPGYVVGLTFTAIDGVESLTATLVRAQAPARTDDPPKVPVVAARARAIVPFSSGQVKTLSLVSGWLLNLPKKFELGTPKLNREPRIVVTSAGLAVFGIACRCSRRYAASLSEIEPALK